MTARHAWLAVCVMLASGCAPSGPPEFAGTNLAVNLKLPGPVVPPHIAKSSATADRCTILEVQGAVQIDLRRAGQLVQRTLVPEQAGTTTLMDLPPADDYEVRVLAGIEADNAQVGVIRFVGSASVALEPDQDQSVTIALAVCDPAVIGENCDPEFGTVCPKPGPARLFTVPARTGCNDYVAAGTKPADTVLMDQNGDQIVSETRAAWVFPLRAIIFSEIEQEGKSKGSIYRQIKTAWYDDTESRSDQQINLVVNYDSAAVCFNPYDVNAGHFASTTTDVTFVWDAGGVSSDVAMILAGPNYPDTAILTAPPAVGGGVYGVAVTGAAVETVAFPRPVTSSFQALLYVDTASGWELQGAFLHDETWLRDVSHPGLP